jgi:hypothetical protein
MPLPFRPAEPSPLGGVRAPQALECAACILLEGILLVWAMQSREKESPRTAPKSLLFEYIYFLVILFTRRFLAKFRKCIEEPR